MMEVAKYLSRIGFTGETEVSLKCLSELQTCHQLAVPFENLDVFCERNKLLELEVLYERIVNEKRGGWCCELNGLFSWLLGQLGFSVRKVSASYFNPVKQQFNKMYDHMGLIVSLAGQEYLTDVGWGNINAHYLPIRLTPNSVHVQPGGSYQLKKESDYWYLMHKLRDTVGHHREEKNAVVDKATWEVIHRFTTEEKELEEFQERCDEYQTDPENQLATVPMSIIKQDEGRTVVVLFGQRLTTVKLMEGTDVRTNQLGLKNEETNKKLKDIFGIVLEKELDIESIVNGLKDDD